LIHFEKNYSHLLIINYATYSVTSVLADHYITSLFTMIRSYPLSSFSNQDEEMVVGEREETNTSEDPPSSPIISYIIQEEVQVEEDYDDIVYGEQWVS